MIAIQVFTLFACLSKCIKLQVKRNCLVFEHKSFITLLISQFHCHTCPTTKQTRHQKQQKELAGSFVSLPIFDLADQGSKLNEASIEYISLQRKFLYGMHAVVSSIAFRVLYG